MDSINSVSESLLNDGNRNAALPFYASSAILKLMNFKLTEGLPSLLSALEEAEVQGNSTMQALLCQEIARVHYISNVPEQGLTFERKAFGIWEELDEALHQNHSLNYQGMMYLKMNKDLEAERAFLKALSGFREGGMRYEEMSVLDQLARLADSKGDTAEAEKLYRQAYDLSLDLSGSFQIPPLRALALFLKKQGHWTEALSLFRNSQTIIADARPYHLGEREAELIDIGRCLQGLKRLEEAKSNFQQCITLLDEQDLPHLEMQAHSSLAQVFEALGDEHSALFHWKEYQPLREQFRRRG